MSRRHLSRFTMPKHWPVSIKETKWIARPMPGPHPINRCITLNILLKDILKHTTTTRETKKILNAGEIFVDKKVRKEYRFPIGIFDVIEIPKLGEAYRLLFGENGKYSLLKIKDIEANLKPAKIIKKTILKKGKIQLNLYDGRNITITKNDYKVGDTVLLDLTKNEIKDHVKFEKGVLIYLTGGKNIGKYGTLKSIQIYKGLQKDKITISVGKKDIETLKDYGFVIGKDKPLVSLAK